MHKLVRDIYHYHKKNFVVMIFAARNYPSMLKITYNTNTNKQILKCISKKMNFKIIFLSLFISKLIQKDVTLVFYK